MVTMSAPRQDELLSYLQVCPESDGWRRTSIRDIAQDLGVTPSRARDLLSRLEQNGKITRMSSLEGTFVKLLAVGGDAAE